MPGQRDQGNFLAALVLPDDVIWLHHFSWHVETVAVAVMAAMFILASRNKAHLNLAIMATVLSTGFALIGIGLALIDNSVLWTTPASYAWGSIAVLGWIGVWASQNKSPCFF